MSEKTNNSALVLLDRPPLRLYKFTAAKYLAGIQNGVFRIGTYRGYRDTEAMPDDVADDGEGTAILTDSTGNIQTYENQSWLSKQIVKLPPHVIFDGFALRLDVDSDYYVLCFHGSSSIRCRASPEYDTCIEIVDPMAFLRRLSEAVQLGAGTFGKCRYDGREHEIAGGDPPPVPLLKPERHKYMDEWRMFFPIGCKPDAKAFTIWAPQLAPLCRVTRFSR